MRNRDYTEKFIFSAIRGFLDAEKKRKQRAKAIEAAKARHSKNRHGREYPRPFTRHGKEYSSISSVALYRKIPAVSIPSISSVQHVQIPLVQVQIPSVQKIQTSQPVQKVEPSSIQQVHHYTFLQTYSYS